MLNPKKNAYLQLVCPINPHVINKSVTKSLRGKFADFTLELPEAKRLESLQPAVYGPYLDVSMAELGYDRVGLRLLVRQLHAEDELTQRQAIITLYDQIEITKNAMYLLVNCKVAFRLIDLMPVENPIMREKVMFTLIRLSHHHEGRKQIMSKPVVLDHLVDMILHDRKELRYAASLLLKTLTRCKECCDIILKHDKLIETLVQAVQNDHMEIVIFHLNTLKNLSELDPVKALKANVFQVTKQLIAFTNRYRIVQAAMDCMTQLCKHEVGKKLADKYDMTRLLQSYLISPNIEVLVSTCGLLSYTTLTNTSKWRMKEFLGLPKHLVRLCRAHHFPALQMRAMQVLINLCEHPDIRAYVKSNLKTNIQKNIAVRSIEDFEGSIESSTYEQKTGLNHSTMCIETVEAMDVNEDEHLPPVDVHSYGKTVQSTKTRLLKTLKYKSWKR